MRNNRAGRKRQRREGNRTPGFERMLIVSEGTQTEVEYFKSIKQQVHDRYKENLIISKIDVDVQGIGRGTMEVVKQAIKLRNRHTYSHVWILIDKDEFTDFDLAIKAAEQEGMSVAWSNKSFELWFLLHYQDVSSPVTNQLLSDRLSTHLQRDGIIQGGYSKSHPIVYDDLKKNLEKAIMRSEKILESHAKSGESRPSFMNPGTKVHELLSILQPYL